MMSYQRLLVLGILAVPMTLFVTLPLIIFGAIVPGYLHDWVVGISQARDGLRTVGIIIVGLALSSAGLIKLAQHQGATETAPMRPRLTLLPTQREAQIIPDQERRAA